MGTSKLSGKPNEMLGSDGQASHPGGIVIWSLLAIEAGISSGRYATQTRDLTFFIDIAIRSGKSRGIYR